MGSDPGRKRTEGRRDGRAVAIVIAATGLFWIAATWAGARWGWSVRTMALMDLIALAGFVFALINVARLWLARRNEG